MKTRYNLCQQRARLLREITRFEERMDQFSGATRPRDKATLTRATRCLRARHVDLARVNRMLRTY